MNSNPALGLIGFWMMLQLAATLAILLGGIYALFCLGRAASGLDRMASALEEWVARQNASTPSNSPLLPGATPQDMGVPSFSQRLQSASQTGPYSQPVPPPPEVQAQPFVPSAPGATPNAAPPSTEYSRPDESIA
jgi:hypothetical protein